MKFSKSLGILIEEALPEWRDKFLSYKDLKKQLKLIYPKDGDKLPNKRPRLADADDRTDGGDIAGEGGEGAEVSKEVTDFVRLLENEMEKFNAFFEEKEEEYVIRWKELQDRVAEAKDLAEELMKVGREIVDFHGEMVLLENYSALNYTGLLKILKKHDKRTGALIRFPFVQKVMQQPFFTTDVLNKLVKECEAMLDHVFSKNGPSVPSEATKVEERCESTTVTENRDRLFRAPTELAEIKHMESVYVRQTISALRVLKEVRSGSSTVSAFSLPPLQTNVVEEDLKNIPVLEQAAK
ncbi:SPX domain-containing protein 1-like isoform X2 [Prunus avium]|uniref:SPX domain-containing protein 1-like isoform X1 n=1 Tax=Prunus avium TaxID=42229 RepID=A0A6P5T5A6_PRUAV|nr:SPX domain-containing protein 1-like isoform X1 [Prunus avium]XP_021822353.1 SPX domain-containing protein 1-like isoform X2 [Prunus avium]